MGLLRNGGDATLGGVRFRICALSEQFDFSSSASFRPLGMANSKEDEKRGERLVPVFVASPAPLRWLAPQKHEK